MRVDLGNSFLKTNALVPGGLRGNGRSQLVDLLNTQATGRGTLDSLRQRMSKLRDELTASYQPKIEDALQTYLQLSRQCRTSQTELELRQGQLNQFDVLSGRLDDLDEALAQAREQGSDMDHIGQLEQARADADRSLTEFVADVNQAEGEDMSGLPSYAGQLNNGRTQQGAGPFTRENFSSLMGDRVSQANAQVATHKQALVDFCQRAGITALEFEQYLDQQKNLTAAFLTAKQDLYTQLQQEGEDDGIRFDQLV